MDKPEGCENKHLAYLDELRAGGQNMMMCVPLLQEKFASLSSSEARAIWQYWFNVHNHRSEEEKDAVRNTKRK